MRCALPAPPRARALAVQQWGFVLQPGEMDALAKSVGESSLLSRTGGAPSLAVGMAHLFNQALGGGGMALWYHFAIMFEALFILTTLDAGTRVGRFMLQDLGGQVWPKFREVTWQPAVWTASALFVSMWGYFLYQGVTDPLGGINSLWPLFGMANQLLAAVALCVGTTVIIRMGKARYAWVTLLPLAWLLIVVLTAGWQKLFSADPRIGFLAHAEKFAALHAAGTLPPGVKSLEALPRMVFNDRLDAAGGRVLPGVGAGDRLRVGADVAGGAGWPSAAGQHRGAGAVGGPLCGRLIHMSRALVLKWVEVLRTVIGVPDYARYVRHMAARHPGCAVMTKDEFARMRLEARYSRPGSRCC